MANIHITEQNFDSGFRGNYKGYHIDTRLIPIPSSISPIVLKMLKYQNTCNLINASRLGLEIYDAIVYLNKLIEKAYLDSYKVKTALSTNVLYEINVQKEQIIHIMKRIIDDIVMTICLFYDFDSFENSYKIRIESLGDLNNNRSGLTDLRQNIKNELNYEKYKSILATINDLHNAYKHSCLMNESHMIINPMGVSFVGYKPARDRKYNHIKFINHNLMHIVIGFSDFLLEFFDVETTSRNHMLNSYERDLT